MSTIVILFAAGMLLLSAEIFIPGGILGCFGVISIIAACIKAYHTYSTTGAALTFFIGLILFFFILYLEFKILPKTKYGKKFFLKESVTGQSNTFIGNDSLIGKTAKAITQLHPTGIVEIESKKYEAYLPNGIANKGEHVSIIGRNAFHLIVKKNS
jgi:membrane-bound ClpP family serine protease